MGRDGMYIFVMSVCEWWSHVLEGRTEAAWKPISGTLTWRPPLPAPACPPMHAARASPSNQPPPLHSCLRCKFLRGPASCSSWARAAGLAGGSGVLQARAGGPCPGGLTSPASPPHCSHWHLKPASRGSVRDTCAAQPGLYITLATLRPTQPWPYTHTNGHLTLCI